MQPTKKHYGEIEIALLPQNIEPFEADAKKIGGDFEMTYQYTNDGARSYLVQSNRVSDLMLVSELVRKYEKMQFNS